MINIFFIKKNIMIKLLYLLIAVFLFSCTKDNQEFRQEKDLKNQKEINFIKENCIKYGNNHQLSPCIIRAKKAFRCLSSTDEYLEKMSAKSKIACRKESNKQFPFSENDQPNNKKEFLLEEDDIDIIQDNIDYFLATGKIHFFRYDEETKKYQISDEENIEENYQDRFSTYYSRNEFIKKCQKNFDDRYDLFKKRYVEKCYKILNKPLEN
jgi:hypothetical protein